MEFTLSLTFAWWQWITFVLGLACSVGTVVLIGRMIFHEESGFIDMRALFYFIGAVICLLLAIIFFMLTF